MKTIRYLTIGCLCIYQALASAEVVSIRFEDSIKSNGYGAINLMRRSTGDKIISSAELEAFRIDNGGYMVFAVDVNEAANGTEKAQSQGITVLQARLDVRINNVVYSFTDFTTKTQSVVAEKGSTNRQMHYTVIGETGSSRITSNTDSDIYGSSFDGTISMPVNIDISQASAAYVHFWLLDTNTKLGDPEAFYDFTAGYEDLAIVSYQDASYLDSLAIGRDLAPLVVLTDSSTNISSHVHYPSSTDYYLVAYEDNYPYKGDYDFNDLVVAYRISYGLTPEGKVKRIQGEGYLVARGGSYDHDWYLHISLPSQASGIGELIQYDPYQNQPRQGYPQSIELTGGLNIKVFDNILSQFYHPDYFYANTLWYAGFTSGQKFHFSIDLDQSIALAKIEAAPFDPFLYVWSTGYEIHLPNKATILAESVNATNQQLAFKTNDGYPFAMILPQEWLFPNEYVDLGYVYPQFVDFIQSGNQNNLDWYQQGILRGLNKHGQQWKW